MKAFIKSILDSTPLTLADFFVFEKGGFIIKYTKWSDDQVVRFKKAAKALGLEFRVGTKPTINKQTGVVYDPSTRVSPPYFGSVDDLESSILASLEASKK